MLYSNIYKLDLSDTVDNNKIFLDSSEILTGVFRLRVELCNQPWRVLFNSSARDRFVTSYCLPFFFSVRIMLSNKI